MAARLTGHPWWKCFEQPLRLMNEEKLSALPQYDIVCASTLATRDPSPVAEAQPRVGCGTSTPGTTS
jgi:hypothetical protein